MSLWKLAWLNIRRNPLMAGLLVFSMSLALGTVGLLYRVESLESERWSLIPDWAPVVVGPKQGGLDLMLSTGLLQVRKLEMIPYRLFETIRAKQDISFEDKSTVSNQKIDLAVPLLMMGKISDHWLVGSDESFLELLKKNSVGQMQSGEWFHNDREIVIGSGLAKKLKKSVGDGLTVNLVGPRGEDLRQDATLKISGILETTQSAWDFAAIGDIRLGWLVYSKLNPQQLSIWGTQVLHYFWLRGSDSSFSELSSLINQRSVAQMALWQEEKAHLQDLLGQGQEMSLLISGLILVICFVVVLALMILRFQHQAPQIASLRALGFSNGKLMSWFSLEASYLLIASLLLGEIWTQVFWQITSFMMKDSVTFMASTWIQTGWEWPVWLCGGAAFAASLLVPWWIVLQENLHERLRA